MSNGFPQWADQVVEHLEDIDKELFSEVLAISEREQGTPRPTESDKMLAWLRGDEPEEAYLAGDAAVMYAGFLQTEWDLYGPEGE